MLDFRKELKREKVAFAEWGGKKRRRLLFCESNDSEERELARRFGSGKSFIIFPMMRKKVIEKLPVM